MQAVVQGEDGARVCHEIVPDRRSETSNIVPGFTAPSPRVLLIDDEHSICRALTLALGATYDIVSFTSAREALHLLARDTAFDVILCDLTMPDMGGEEVYEELCQHAPEHVNRLVFMSGAVFGTGTASFLRHTRSVCLEKPFDMRVLREVIDGHGARSSQSETSS